ncbi:flagellar protein FlgN [Enterobacteriaceae bacterium RIT711]|nr:flagellar protein FlgN [Enterobacteriaceae bacterium RIT711]
MSNKLEQVKLLLRGIRTDVEHYQQLRALLEEQRLCMIRRASEALLAVNARINMHYELLSNSTRERRETLLTLGVTADCAGINQVFSWLPVQQKDAAKGLWKQLEHLAENCKAFNEKNGELLTMQYEFVQVFLGTEPNFIYQR